MERDPILTIRLGRRELLVLASIFLIALFAVMSPRSEGQEVQKDYGEKFNIADKGGGIGVAASTDGKYVFVAGPEGILVSDDFGKTGSWVQTVRLK